MSEAKYTEKLEDEIADLENETEELGTKITEQQDTIQGLTVEIGSLKNKIESLEDEVEHLEGTNVNQREEIVSLELDIEELKDKVIELRSEVDDLETDQDVIDELKDKIENLKLEKAHLRQQIEDVEDLQATIREHEDYIEELENATRGNDIDEVEFVLQDYKELKTLLLTKVKPSDLMLGLTHYLKNIL